MGPAGLSRLVAAPAIFRHLPRGMQTKIAHRAIRPAGARWLVDRLDQVPLTTGRTVVRAQAMQMSCTRRLTTVQNGWLTT